MLGEDVVDITYERVYVKVNTDFDVTEYVIPKIDYLV
jgi:hypothetical protein